MCVIGQINVLSIYLSIYLFISKRNVADIRVDDISIMDKKGEEEEVVRDKPSFAGGVLGTIKYSFGRFRQVENRASVARG